MRRLVNRYLVLFALVLAGPAAAQGLLETFEPSVTEFTLDNGLTFVVVERHEAPVVSFMTYADVGSVDEPKGQTGIAHMFEHMAFKGTTSVGTADLDAELAALEAEEAAYQRLRAARLGGAPPAEVERLEAAFVALRDSAKALVEESAFERILERNGAVGLNAFTSADQTGYLYSLPANKLELWFAMEADRFRHPVLREYYVERDVVMEERRMRTESNPIGRLFEEFVTTAFKAHPYGQPTVGHMSDLQSISRTEAEAFFDRYYAANNLTIAIVGDVDPAQVRQLAERYFGPLPRRPEPERIGTVEPPQLGERRVTLVEQAQPFVFVGYHRPGGYHEDDAAFQVLTDVLANGRTSRLYRALVESELALSANVISAFPGEKYPTLYVVYGVPSRGVDPREVETAIYGVLDDVIEDGVTEEELERAKTRARASLVSGLESNLGLAVALAEVEALTGDWRNLFRELDAIEAVTAADVQRVAAETFRPSNRTVATLRTEAAMEDG
ncbi:MAG TPA: pitrilysin family protein [Rubricoccaceae bacterium]|nr:pitrilysin family protein [Rubricoccaceae bacterium]